jgi:hypothetical protein
MRVAAAVCLMAAACSYTSLYVAPVDGRARVVFKDGVATVTGPPQLLSADCQRRVEQIIGAQSPQVAVARPIVHPAWSGATTIAARPTAKASSASRSSPADLGRAALGVIVLAPVVAVVLVASPSEAPAPTSAAIDWANAFNDARNRGEWECGG